MKRIYMTDLCYRPLIYEDISLCELQQDYSQEDLCFFCGQKILYAFIKTFYAQLDAAVPIKPQQWHAKKQEIEKILSSLSYYFQAESNKHWLKSFPDTPENRDMYAQHLRTQDIWNELQEQQPFEYTRALQSKSQDIDLVLPVVSRQQQLDIALDIIDRMSEFWKLNARLVDQRKNSQFYTYFTRGPVKLPYSTTLQRSPIKPVLFRLPLSLCVNRNELCFVCAQSLYNLFMQSIEKKFYLLLEWVQRVQTFMPNKDLRKILEQRYITFLKEWGHYFFNADKNKYFDETVNALPFYSPSNLNTNEFTGLFRLQKDIKSTADIVQLMINLYMRWQSLLSEIVQDLKSYGWTSKTLSSKYLCNQYKTQRDCDNAFSLGCEWNKGWIFSNCEFEYPEYRSKELSNLDTLLRHFT